MTDKAFEAGNWNGVIEAHPLESHDPNEWLRYGIALLQTMEPGPDVGKQLQQAALAFVQAIKEGASSDQVARAQQQSARLSLKQALELAGIHCGHTAPPEQPMAGASGAPSPSPLVMHLHGFKCAGSTFIWSLERSTAGRVAYIETDQVNKRLPWQLIAQHLDSLPNPPVAITSHLATLPPANEISLIKVAFLRDPVDRIVSSYQFEQRSKTPNLPPSLEAYCKRFTQGALSNYMTRHLSPQQDEDWLAREGWGARPEMIDLHRSDLFVGLVERYDESIVVLEHWLAANGHPLDLAYPQPINTSRPDDPVREEAKQLPASLLLDATELDAGLYRRTAERLEERIQAIDNFDERLATFRQRCAALRAERPSIAIKPAQEWTRLKPG